MINIETINRPYIPFRETFLFNIVIKINVSREILLNIFSYFYSY